MGKSVCQVAIRESLVSGREETYAIANELLQVEVVHGEDFVAFLAKLLNVVVRTGNSSATSLENVVRLRSVLSNYKNGIDKTANIDEKRHAEC